MGHPRPDAEKAYLEVQLGNRWQRILSNGQIFNWFADYAVLESKIDRDKVVKRLRVFSSREEDPTVFWVILMTRFYEEGAHLGLRRYIEDGVTYHCPPQFFSDFRALCQSAPSRKNTVLWVFRPDYLNGWIFAHVFCAGDRNWFKRSWPDGMRLRGKRYLVTYYPSSAVNALAEMVDDDDDETSLEGYRNTHSLLCLAFGTKSPAAYDISLGSYASASTFGVVNDPYLGVSSPGFNKAALQIVGLCVQKGKTLKNSSLRSQVLELLEILAKTYSELESAMVGDSDYMHLMTYPLMPLSKKSRYGAVMADFEAAMKTVVIGNADEIITLARLMSGDRDEVSLYTAGAEADSQGRYPLEAVRHYLANARTRQSMSLEGFDALRQISEKIEGKSSEIRIAALKEIVRKHVPKLTDTVEATGEFPITGPLMVALMEVGQVRYEGSTSDYRDLIYRTKSNRPWLRTSAKFAGETDDLEEIRNEFLAFCRIITGKR